MEFNPSTVYELREALTKAGSLPGSHYINLTPSGLYTFNDVHNTTAHGANTLPAVQGKIAILGNGATLERAADSPEFRLFEVAPGSCLLMDDVIIQGFTQPNGSAVFIRSDAPDETGIEATFQTCIFNNNAADPNAPGYFGTIAGGAIAAYGQNLGDPSRSITVAVHGCVFTNCTAKF
ncbi:MAG: hypothetical protein L0287_25890, partial [Anaerolineae bacterium]|nr:hypothetical protein [Anaerolineae bacterium]